MRSRLWPAIPIIAKDKIKVGLPLLLSIIALTFMPSAYAADKKQDLKTLEAQVKAEELKKAEAAKKMQTLEKDMKGLKNNLIKTTSLVQKNEKEIGTLEERLAKLSARKKEVLSGLNKDRESMAELVIALERIRRLPPQALVARPGAPLETAQAAIVLGAIMPELNKRADDLRQRLAELEDVENDFVSNKTKLKTTSEKLKENKGKMESLVSERQNALESAKGDLVEQEKQVASLSRKASDLKDLIQKLGEEKRKAKAAAQKAQKTESAPRKKKIDESKLGLSLATLGPSRLPVPGTISISYGQPDEIGAASEGLHIKSRKGAVVVAPLSGVVRYAGPFKSYGSIVLLEHKNNYHSLIAGLGRIDTVVGQSVDAGEPLGSLGAAPSLYYELRYNGQPINPARKFPDLG